MSFSWKLGRVAGIDLYLHPTFLLFLAFLAATYSNGLMVVALVSTVFGCVVLHELGHALMARQFGIGTRDITLYPIGGVARLQRMPRAPGAELLIALAGPVVNILLALAFMGIDASSLVWGLWPTGSIADLFVSSLITINLGLALFNMIPAFPMDGGRVLRALLSGWLGRTRATQIAAQLGQMLALLFAIACLSRGAWLQAVLAGFVIMAARMELAQVLAEEHRRRAPRLDEGIWLVPPGLAQDHGISVAPPGYTWVSRGDGVWQLTPIVVHVSKPTHSWH